MATDMIPVSGGLNFGSELEETEKALREVTLMIEQSQGEVSKLSQRNAAITTHLQQMQGQPGQGARQFGGKPQMSEP